MCECVRERERERKRKRKRERERERESAVCEREGEREREKVRELLNGCRVQNTRVRKVLYTQIRQVFEVVLFVPWNARTFRQDCVFTHTHTHHIHAHIPVHTRTRTLVYRSVLYYVQCTDFHKWRST